MRSFVFLSACLLCALPALAQSDYLARLPVAGSVSELAVSPAEEVWIATRVGSVYSTRRVGDLWQTGPFQTGSPDPLPSGVTFERASFFSENVVMLSGFIQENGKQDFVYWSPDHGRSWQKVRFGESSWIDAAYVGNNGKAWMSGSSQLIYYTDDSGRTWQSFPKVEATGNLRFATIHFAPDGRTGLFGSHWNVLYRTADNCQSWDKLPTPLGQHKYQPLEEDGRPEIQKVRIVGGSYLVRQQGRVFSSPAHPIDWQALPGVVDFDVSESGRVYTLRQDRSVQLLDAALRPVWSSRERLAQEHRALAVRNEKLFVYTDEKIYKISPQEFVGSDLLINAPIEAPDDTLRHAGALYGFAERDMLHYEPANHQWRRLLTLDFEVANAAVVADNLLVADGDLRQYYALDVARRSITKFSLPAMLVDLGKARIKELHFETGSQGCFHSENSRKVFIRHHDQFVLDQQHSTKGYLTSTPLKIGADIVYQLAATISTTQLRPVTLADLRIEPADVTRFARFIDQQEATRTQAGLRLPDPDNPYRFPGKNPDFSFYRNTAATLATLPPQTIDDAFWQRSGSWSTTRDSRRVIFVFDDGQQLVVENADDVPSYLFTPWVVSYDGLRLRNNSLAFGQQVSALTKGQFFGETAGDKNYALYKITDYLYRQQLRQAGR